MLPEWESNQIFIILAAFKGTSTCFVLLVYHVLVLSISHVLCVFYLYLSLYLYVFVFVFYSYRQKLIWSLTLGNGRPGQAG